MSPSTVLIVLILAENVLPSRIHQYPNRGQLSEFLTRKYGIKSDEDSGERVYVKIETTPNDKRIKRYGNYYENENKDVLHSDFGVFENTHRTDNNNFNVNIRDDILEFLAEKYSNKNYTLNNQNSNNKLQNLNNNNLQNLNNNNLQNLNNNNLQNLNSNSIQNLNNNKLQNIYNNNLENLNNNNLQSLLNNNKLHNSNNNKLQSLYNNNLLNLNNNNFQNLNTNNINNNLQNFINDELEIKPFYQIKPPKFQSFTNDLESTENIYELNNILKKQLVKLQRDKNTYSENLVQSDYIYPDSAEVTNDSITQEVGEVIKQPVGLDNSKFFVPLKGLKNKTINLANKFLSLFTIVQFSNSRCQASSASSVYEGFCYHRLECIERNGTPIGFCANGYGVCCVDRHTCGGVSNKNCTYFESPGYPNYFPNNGSVVIPTTTTPIPGLTPDPRIKDFEYGRQEDLSLSLACAFRILKANPRVSQLRIDFLDLELRGPTNGTCVNERLVISGQGVSSRIPVICGYNTGQHMYVDVRNMVGPLQLSILSNTIDRKRYRIRICQYEASCESSMNCLQYFTGVQGVITSFNYEQSASFNRSIPGYLNGMNYGICIRREAGYCSVTYTNVQNGIEYPFQLVNFLASGFPTVPVGQAGVEIFNCLNDYIVINSIRLCGYKLNDGSIQDNFLLNAPVTDSNAGPIIIPVRTDSVNATGRGFKLFYTQNRCT